MRSTRAAWSEGRLALQVFGCSAIIEGASFQTFNSNPSPNAATVFWNDAIRSSLSSRMRMVRVAAIIKLMRTRPIPASLLHQHAFPLPDADDSLRAGIEFQKVL